MGNVCSGLTRGKEEKPHTVSLQAYNEIRIIPPTPSPGFVTSSSIAECPDGAEFVIVKPPTKLAPLAEPESLSPAPPPKKEITDAAIIPESPDSDTERLLSPQGDDLTQDAVDSELLIDDTPAESPLVTESAPTAMIAASAMTTTTTVAASTTTIPDKILANGFGISDDRIPLTDAEVLCDDSPPSPIPSSSKKVVSPTVVVTTDLASPFPLLNDASSSPPVVIGSPPLATPTPTTNAEEPNYSSQSPPREALTVDAEDNQKSVNVVDNRDNVNGGFEISVNGDVDGLDGVVTGLNGHVNDNDRVNGDVDGLIGDVDGLNGDVDDLNVDVTGLKGHVNGSDLVNGIAKEIEAIPEEMEVDYSLKNAESEASVLKQKTTTTTTTVILEDQGLRTDNIGIEIVANGTLPTPRSTISASSHEVDHNLNEQSVNGRRKDGDYFLEITRNEENRIQTMCSNMEENLSSSLSEEVEGQIRAFIGKATLLTTKKFKQFKGLCKQNLEPEEGEAFQTTDEDLQGFWDLMTIQRDELDASYKDLLEFKSNNWSRPAKINESKSATNTPAGARRKGVGAKKVTPSPAKSAEAEARNKAREEARRKLIAAKREAARNLEKGKESGSTVEAKENGVTHVNGDGGVENGLTHVDGVEEAEEDGVTGLRRKKSLSFTIIP